jgi:phosphoribosyl 1,2-cyclic phosphate phosphodiesterase
MNEITNIPSCTLTFLGTGASCGVPSFYCGCIACEEARKNPRAARDCSDIIISGTQNTLIDAAPDLRRQLVRDNISSIDRVLLTHEHFDHIGGIPQLEYLVRLKQKQAIALYGSGESIAAITNSFPFMDNELEFHQLVTWEQLSFDGVRYTALPATHTKGSYGYLIETGATKVGYFPDTGPLCDSTIEWLKGVDILIIDATFNGDNWMPNVHLSVDGAIEEALKLKPRTTYLTHLSMHYDTPVTTAQLEQKLAKYNGAIQLAYDGLSILI